MGSNPEKFFAAMDEALGAVSQAKVDQDNGALNRMLFEAAITVRAEKQLLEEQLEGAKERLSAVKGSGL